MKPGAFFKLFLLLCVGSVAAAPFPAKSAKGKNGGNDTLVTGGSSSSSNSTGGGGSSNSFAGANNYYLYTLPEKERGELLDAMKDAGMKVLRTWVSGHSAGQKASDNSQIADVEGPIGTYNDAILDSIDQLMIEAHQRGIKLLIGLYDQNALKGGDIYGKKYTKEGFYTNKNAISDFDNRMKHILTDHKSKVAGNKPWSELGQYIFGLEAQNEPMIFDQSLYMKNLNWICDRSSKIRSYVPDKKILITTGGGAGKASVQPEFFKDSCPVDLISIHDYSDDYESFLPDAINKAKSAGKTLLVEEWGSLYGGSRSSNLKSNLNTLQKYQISWLYWQLITNKDPHQGEDYEIQINSGDDWKTLSDASKKMGQTKGPFDFSGSLGL